jgi:TetR/AcrR family transcriptional regulator
MKSKRPAKPSPVPQPSRGAKSRAAIVAAAAQVFAQAGFAGARTDAIADAAGVNKALLYYYFKSKESLYEAVVEDHFREFNRQALEVLASPDPARAVLLRYVDLHFDFISSKHQSAPLFQQLMMNRGKFLQRLIRAYFKPRSEALGQVIDRGMREGEFRPADRFNTAVSIVSLIVFYFSAAPVMQMMGWPDAYSPASLKRRKQEVLDFIRHGLFLDPHFTPQ